MMFLNFHQHPRARVASAAGPPRGSACGLAMFFLMLCLMLAMLGVLQLTAALAKNTPSLPGYHMHGRCIFVNYFLARVASTPWASRGLATPI